MVLKRKICVSGSLRRWGMMLLLVPAAAMAQPAAQTTAAGATAKKTETEAVYLLAEEEDKMEASFAAEGKAWFLRLTGTGRSAHTINTDDPVIFLLQNDSTVTLRATAVQGFDDLDSTRSYRHEYSVQQQDLEMLSRSRVQAVRKYTVIGFDDYTLDEPAAANLHALSTDFLQKLDREGLLKKVVVTEPAFPGGTAVLLSFLNKNLKPLPALAANGQKTARVQIGVDEEGRIKNVAIKQSAGAVYDAEIQRMIGRMPRWKAGLADGNAIERDVVLQLRFYQAPDGVKLALN
ncbi:hypothetical protein HRG84_21540 [Flavisolibacter sp. BT320]|nr:hypothetical protein [Flavisolibacter longurius]